MFAQVGMVGDSQTGKTGLMARYVDRDFDPHYTETGGDSAITLAFLHQDTVPDCACGMSAVCFHEKKEKVAGCDIKLSIWDVGGQTREVEQVCENASCVLFVFDLSRPHTLNSVRRPEPRLLLPRTFLSRPSTPRAHPTLCEQIKDWHRKARAVNKHAFPILVGTKFDIFAQTNPQKAHEIAQEQLDVTNRARAFAKVMRAPLVFCSAALSINITKIFQIVVSQVFQLELTDSWAIDGISGNGEPILELSHIINAATGEEGDNDDNDEYGGGGEAGAGGAGAGE